MSPETSPGFHLGCGAVGPRSGEGHRPGSRLFVRPFIHSFFEVRINVTTLFMSTYHVPGSPLGLGYILAGEADRMRQRKQYSPGVIPAVEQIHRGWVWATLDSNRFSCLVTLGVLPLALPCAVLLRVFPRPARGDFY